MTIPTRTTLRTAWKESPAVIRAMGDGRHLVLLSHVAPEGRDREARLVIQHLEFFLFPRRQEGPRERFRPEFTSCLDGPVDNDGRQVTLRYRALVTDAVMVMQGFQVAGLSPFHIWTDDFVRHQIRWDPKDPVFALTCKVQRIDPPFAIPWVEPYGVPGDWVTIAEAELPPAVFTPVLEHKEFLKRALDIKKAFAEVHRNPLEPEPAPAGADPTASPAGGPDRAAPGRPEAAAS
jgi:hypothetical protein